MNDMGWTIEDINKKTNKGDTALALAKKNNCEEDVIEFMIDLGAMSNVFLLLTKD